MKKHEIINKLSRKFNRTTMRVKKYSPEILLVTGIVGTVASAVMACKATTKVNDIIEATKNNVDIIHDSVERGNVPMKNEDGEYSTVPYNEEDGKKDLTIIYAQTGMSLVKLYAPSVILGVASISFILASHNIIHKRNAALSAAYAIVDKDFKTYRNRLIERFGEELDKELKYNIKAKQIEEVVGQDSDGNDIIKTETVNVADPNLNSSYARFFDETCTGWTRDADYNLMFLRQMQNWANDKLKSQGHLYLNEVYKMLGIPESKAGQIVGWIYDEENPTGDNFVDFGIYDLHNPQKRLFVNGREKSILLDFNVDGDIWSLMA